ncbi:MAG: hypothetical protein HZA91_09565 [Verrucomicrobia bacterium]|nr:hypothetical protein [Verrucomicrobiota bacterium]
MITVIETGASLIVIGVNVPDACTGTFMSCSSGSFRNSSTDVGPPDGARICV